VTTFPITTPIIVLVGPTAIGKTSLSLTLAQDFNCEIISIDSMQVYRYMDIGTAKVTEEEKRGVPHHLIDIVDPDEDYDAQNFVNDSLAAINEIQERGKIPLLTGGTGLYLKSLVQGLFAEIGEYPEVRVKLKEELQNEGLSKMHEELSICDCITAKKVHVNDTHRILRALEIFRGTGIPWSEHLRLQREKEVKQRFTSMIQLALTCERKHLYERINLRTQYMIEDGLIEETEKLLGMGFQSTLKSMNAIGYRHAVAVLEGKLSLEEAVRTLARDTRRYAKRQYTWFNRNETLEWFDVASVNEINKHIRKKLSQ
jgi:tRNA dimethylallyltransferase